LPLVPLKALRDQRCRCYLINDLAQSMEFCVLFLPSLALDAGKGALPVPFIALQSVKLCD
jgi:hypothetical protein